MESKSEIEKLRETKKYKDTGKEVNDILNSCIEILLDNDFSDKEINLLFRHALFTKKLIRMEADEKTRKKRFEMYFADI